MMKNAYYLILKVLFVLQIFTFLSFFGHGGTRLNKNLWLISIFMASKNWNMHIDPISREVKVIRQ